MSTTPPFRYENYTLDPDRGRLTCRYSLGGRRFEERVTFDSTGLWATPAVSAAARLVFLLAGVSYYKTVAPPVIDLGHTSVSDTEREFLRKFYLEGLGEYTYRNRLDLSRLRIEGPARESPATERPARDWHDTEQGRPLVPFSGGMGSVVTAELVRQRTKPVLFILSRPGEHFDTSERSAAVAGLPIARAEREVDAQLRLSREAGFLDEGTPLTGILSAIAVMAAALEGCDAVVMSNHWSTSMPSLKGRGWAINSQYSKSAAFEVGFRCVLADILGGQLSYFSALRPFSQLWVARRFAEITKYHHAFLGCEGAMRANTLLPLNSWCGRCEKCCLANLMLAPFLSPAELRSIFVGPEPLNGSDCTGLLAARFHKLLGISSEGKTHKFVTEIGERRAAVTLAARRQDRADAKLLQALAAKLPAQDYLATATVLLQPMGGHFIPDRYAIGDLSA